MSAVLSACGRYRYKLTRQVAETGLTFGFFGVNPSTADASLDDSTVKKWRGFTRLNGGSGFIVGNVFGLRSTAVKHLAGWEDPFGPLNCIYLQQVIEESDVLVPCWGSLAKLPAPLRGAPPELLTWLQAAGKPLMCFGLTQDGQPKHPLMLGYGTQLMAVPS